MTRLVVGLCAAFWLGSLLLFSRFPFFRKTPLADRLLPYAQGRSAGRSGRGFSGASVSEVLGPLARSFGQALAKLFGVREELATRLERTHSELDPTAFRLRQFGWCVVSFSAGLLLMFLSAVAPAVGLFFTLGGALLPFLLLEQQLANQSIRWKRRVFLELPVIEEQIAILLTAGYSLGAAMNRVASRGNGACAADLRRVCLHIRQGRSDHEALLAWAALAEQDGVHRLVSILSLDRESSDLGRLVSDEARASRREAHRELLASVEKKSQQVWIPVTFATLVPGVIFVSVPFVAALDLFTN